MDEKDLEAVIQRSTVEFSRALSLTGTLRLLSSIGYVLQARMIYDVSYHVDRREISNLSINGTIKLDLFGAKGVSDSFRSYPYEQLRGDKIKGFKFVIIPGYKISDHRKEVVALWDRVNEFIVNRFSR